jgi:hypothetical protein
MAQGKKTDSQTIYNIMDSYFETRNFTQTGRNLEVPVSTVEKIVKEHIKDKEFVELWNKKKEDFATKADLLIYKAMDRLSKELDSEDKISVNNLSTVIGTLYDKRTIANNGGTPNVEIKIVDNSNLEKAMYDGNDKV